MKQSIKDAFIAMLITIWLTSPIILSSVILLNNDTKEEVDENTDYILELMEIIDRQEIAINELQNNLVETSRVVDDILSIVEYNLNETDNVKLYLETIRDNGYAIPKVLNRTIGVCYYNGHFETYYNLPMEHVVSIARSKLDGYSDTEYWIRNDGVKMLGAYIMAAANYSDYEYGTIVETSLGEAIIVDTGTDLKNKIDIAVDW